MNDKKLFASRAVFIYVIKIKPAGDEKRMNSVSSFTMLKYGQEIKNESQKRRE
jgi:hypothetical protein